MLFSFLILLILINYVISKTATIKKTTSSMNIQHKIGQMGQLDIGLFMKPDRTVDYDMMWSWFDSYKTGSVLDAPTSVGPFDDGNSGWNATEWRQLINTMQSISMQTTGIPILYGLDSIHGATYVKGATLFPAQLNIAATFNPEHARITGEITSKDTRAAGIQWLFSPVQGLALHPAWARFHETFGEDPHLAAMMGAAMIDGIQTEGDVGYPTKAAACMKHFIGYSQPYSGKWCSDVMLMLMCYCCRYCYYYCLYL